ncbi:MAG: hypothetical protein ACWGKN_15955 [Desulfoprunum sp.]
MGTKAKTKNETILLALSNANEASQKEQDHYRQIIDRALQEGKEGDIAAKVKSSGVEALHRIMKDCVFPPDHEERKSFLDIGDGQTLVGLGLAEVNDMKIRTHLFFLNEVIEQTQRLSAMAKFSERVGPLKGPGAQVFHFWARWSSVRALQKEATKLGRSAEAEMAGRFGKGLELILGRLLEIWPEQLDLGPLKKIDRSA